MSTSSSKGSGAKGSIKAREGPEAGNKTREGPDIGKGMVLATPALVPSILGKPPTFWQEPADKTPNPVAKIAGISLMSYLKAR